METSSIQNIADSAPAPCVNEHSHQVDKKNYHSPRFEKYGSLRNITLGGSPGAGDSGASPTYKPFGQIDAF